MEVYVLDTLGNDLAAGEAGGSTEDNPTRNALHEGDMQVAVAGTQLNSGRPSQECEEEAAARESFRTAVDVVDGRAKRMWTQEAGALGERADLPSDSA